MQIKKNPKADLGRWSFVFFQIGLILLLAVTYIGLEWRFSENGDLDLQEVTVSDFEQEDVPITQINTPPPPPPPPPPPMPEVIEVVEDKMEVEETKIQSTESSQEQKIEIVEVQEITYEEEEEEIEKIPFMVVQNIPIYPGCENIKEKEAQKKCMSEKIDAHVKKEFRTHISEELGLTGLNRIFVVFKIDEKGYVADIRARGPNKRLEEEAIRVVKLLPKMKPGRQRDKAVAVEYSLPIMFEIRERI
ncbi:energy transducer TonB [Salinimicrobium xinjiangense]|uniref:energy transducer TonB n=1 Tax=Salinimicrobium xinjiangense TaxID=438596 RepID=UPI000423A8FA|nr:energy transducer TonB [Salinimicrobium xinjiangense]